MKKRIFTFISVLLLVASINYSSAAVISVPASSHDSTVLNEPDPSSVKSAVDEFKGLTKKEKRERVKAAKMELKSYKAKKKGGDDVSTNTLLLVILAILLPPLAVFLHDGEINSHFWIDLLLTLLFYVPGLIYALVIILRKE